MVEKRAEAMAERKAEEEKALNDAFPDDAIEAIADDVLGAFNDIAGMKETELLDNVLGEVCQSKEQT